MKPDWQEAYEDAYRRVYPGNDPVCVSEWSSGWFYIMEKAKILTFKPSLYRRKQIKEMTKRLLSREPVPVGSRPNP